MRQISCKILPNLFEFPLTFNHVHTLTGLIIYERKEVVFPFVLHVYIISPVSSYDRVISLCRNSSVSETRKVFVYANCLTDAE